MRQWTKLLTALSVRQRVALVVVAVAVAAGLTAFSRWKHERDFAVLYTALEASDAGAVVARLKETGVDYRLSEDGRTVRVPSAKVAEVRLSMASAGVPRNGRIGFELFDQTNLGTTEFAEHINYGRALEGELERSIIYLTEVEQARVHVTFSKDSVFLESRQPAKGSVVLKLRPGARVTAQNVQAICHLVASAVEGLAPESVSVIDTAGSLLSRPRRASLSGEADPSDAMIEYQRGIERDLLAKIDSTLEPLLGPEKFRASVAVVCDFSSGEQSEETFDPTRSVMVASQRTEDVSGTATASGVPGTPSNLPRPTSRPGATQGGVARRTENISYQTSRVVRRIHLPVGAVKRISASVLVDHDIRWNGAGATARRVVEPPAPERLKSIEGILAASIGLDPARGDQLVVQSLPFDTTLRPEALAPAPGVTPSTAPAPLWIDRVLGDWKFKIIAAGTGLLLMLLALWSLFAMKKRQKTEIDVPTSLPPANLKDRTTLKNGQASAQLGEPADAAESQTLELPPVHAKRSDILADRLREMVTNDPAASAQILRTWLIEKNT